MALISNDMLTFADWHGRRDPNGAHAKIAEVMSRKDEAFADIPFMMANQPLSHRDTLRSEIPQAEKRAFNQGVGRGKTKTRDIVDGIANYQLYGVVDKDLADLSGDAASFRFNEEKGVMEGIAQQIMDDVWYGDVAVDPLGFTGFTPRYNALSNAQVVSAGGTTNLASMWLVAWGNESVRGIFPKGHETVGLEVSDKGVETVLADDGVKEFEAYRTHYKHMMGLSIKDYRQVARVANIDTLAVDSAGDVLVEALIDAVSLIEDPTNLKIYVNRQVWTRLIKEERKSAHLSLTEVQGRKVMSFWQYPIRRSDSLISNETQVV